MTRTRVLICQPVYGGAEEEARDATHFHAVASKERVHIFLNRPKASLLCNAFNQGVVHALRNKMDYFLLLHGDIHPEDGWLDKMLDLLREHELDALHRVSPIKDGRGLTSTALGYFDDIFAPMRRITVKELTQLPATFTLADCQYAIAPEAIRLLPNTGCLLCPCDTWLCDFPGFMIHDRIIRSGDDWDMDTCSEDWAFGHWCGSQGLRVGGTTAFRLKHYGRYGYSTDANEYHYGEERDESFFNAIANLEVLNAV